MLGKDILAVRARLTCFSVESHTPSIIYFLACAGVNYSSRKKSYHKSCTVGVRITLIICLVQTIPVCFFARSTTRTANSTISYKLVCKKELNKRSYVISYIMRRNKYTLTTKVNVKRTHRHIGLHYNLLVHNMGDPSVHHLNTLIHHIVAQGCCNRDIFLDSAHSLVKCRRHT